MFSPPALHNSVTVSQHNCAGVYRTTCVPISHERRPSTQHRLALSTQHAGWLCRPNTLSSRAMHCTARRLSLSLSQGAALLTRDPQSPPLSTKASLCHQGNSRPPSTEGKDPRPPAVDRGVSYSACALPGDPHVASPHSLRQWEKGTWQLEP
ncbi:hypothetical protein GWK47_036532 [Chionoecetes opilio]|uniref:Uncharacterized protein n=1 Tax=Chionoecetes opilio TaxID=41210 RepID=A0A8J5CMZ9_CHIOP|nr:hypothetical protein GWK47_036532 [Chionoecetes opilio]